MLSHSDMTGFPFRLVASVLLLGACVTDPAVDEGDDSGGKSDSPDSRDNPKVPSGDATRLPIVLVHGFNASPTSFGFGPEVVSALCDDGHAVFAPALPPFASIETRGDELAIEIDRVLAGGVDECGVEPAIRPTHVNLIAHSMGGLDSRFVVASLGYGDRVASITTISTPHRGSAVADMVLGLTSRIDRDALAALAALISRPLESPSTIAPDLRAAFTALAESTAQAFNDANPDDSRVVYESWAGLSNVAGIANPQDAAACENKLDLFASGFKRHRMHVALKAIAAVVAHALDLRPNDGLVQVASAKHGVFRGCMPADHADEVGAFGKQTRFDHVRFVRNRSFELAARGF